MPWNSRHRRRPGPGRSLAWLALVFAPVATPAAGQSTAEIIRGRVIGPDSLPLNGAEVRVTGLLTRDTQTARTDESGVYTLVFQNAEGEYLLSARRVGFRSRSIRLSRVGLSPILGAEIVLERASQLLERVVVIAGDSAERRAIGEVGSGALADSLFLADPSRLMDLLLSIPGVESFDDSTFSVLGASSGQNIRTLDGVTVRGGDLPPDALASMSVVTSSADPARGGFAGGNITQRLRGGTDIFAATLRFAGSNRGLAWSDPAHNRPIPRPISHSGTAHGPIIRQKLRYNLSWSVEDNASEWYSLLEPRESLLGQRGVSLDSVAMVAAALGDLGVPVALGSGPQGASNRTIRTTEVVDFSPSATTSLRLSHNGRWSTSIGTGGGNSELSFPTSVNELGVNSHSFGLRASGYFRGLLNEMTAGLNYYTDDSDPFTLLPSGSVRIGTDFSDGRTGFSSLTFGGGNGHYYEKTWSGELINEVSWIPGTGDHRVKFGGRIRFNRSNHFYYPGSPLLGEYSYLTAEDLAANRPASYERVLATTPRNTHDRTSALWVGDEWKVSDALELQGGLRFDFAHPGTRPQYNPAVEQVFGVRTDRVPRDVGWSPRIGFSWTSETRRGRRTGGSSTLGGLSASAVAAMSPDLVRSLIAMQRASTLPGIRVTGTVGAYRGFIGTDEIAQLVEATGLPGTRVSLSCVGDAVPIPDWRHMAEGPTACADGTTGSPFSIARPLVRVFDPAFRAPASWRGELEVDGIRVPGDWIMEVATEFAFNGSQESAIDLNLNRTPLFHLDGEGGRPVYAARDAIVPSSGSISSGASRISPDFATVTSAVSDLRSYQVQFRASVAPPQPLLNRRVALNLRYSHSLGRSQVRSSSRVGTAGDPFAKEWVANSQPTHSFRLTSSGRFWGLNLGFATNLYSGLPMTPMVSGDVNGDGRSNNDRAFLPDPATTPDTSLARQLNELMSHARPFARKCLTSQFGRIVGANSCRTPWQIRYDISASFTPPSSWSYSDRLQFTFNISNSNGVLVRALGLENTPLGQTGLSTTPNPTLLYVTGFDPATNRFRYRVNQLFGEPSNFGSLRRRFGSAQLRLGMAYTFGGPVPNPIARGLGLREPVNEDPLTEEQRRAAVGRLKRDPVAPVVSLRDSLGLGADQLEQLDRLAKEYGIRADTALQPLMDYVLSRGRRVFDKDLARPLSAAQSALNRLNTEYDEKALAVLTPVQRAHYAEVAGKRER